MKKLMFAFSTLGLFALGACEYQGVEENGVYEDEGVFEEEGAYEEEGVFEEEGAYQEEGVFDEGAEEPLE